jgi:indole-3-glycerol phosphate synthase
VAGDDVVLVAESGIASAADVRRARDAGADAVLVGEALMRAADPGALLAELVAAGDSP